jgi:transposase
MTTEPCYIGIDIAKAKLDVAVQPGARWVAATFAQDPAGLTALLTWLRECGAATGHVCLEATGVYGDAVARALHTADYRVSILNPAVLKAFRHSTLTRTKNDRTDARLLARYAALHQPAAWSPPAPEHQELQALSRRLESLQQMRQQELNRRESSTRSATVTASIDQMVQVFDQEIERLQTLIDDHIDHHPTLHEQHDLLQTIPGIGAKTATGLLAECGDLRQFDDARQAAAYAGLTPKEHISGSSVWARPRLSKVGSARLRKLLYFPAISAKTHNPIVRAFCDQLCARGKHTMTVIGAAMRKLLHLAYGVLKSGRPFDPNFGRKAAHPA